MTTTPQVSVEHLSGDRFAVLVRSHTVVVVDQPDAAGGLDTGPTPTELLVGALAGCVAFYARRYLARHRLPEAGLAVTASYTTADRPARIAGVTVHVDVPAGLTSDQRQALLAVASHCTVHNTLRQPPEVTVELAGDPVAVA